MPIPLFHSSIAAQFLPKMLLGLSEALPALVEAKFKSAKAAQSLILSSTELAIIHTAQGVPFQLRYCPSLSKKPKPQTDNNAPPKKKFDPFENPPHDLLVADVPTANPSHWLVLNKFPIITEHFILATKVNKQQTHILEQDDLEATFACLQAWQDGGAHGQQERLFAFFNSGDHSGASQPHRHLQFLPLKSMKAGEQSDGWDLLIDLILSQQKPAKRGLLQHTGVPFTHYAMEFSSQPSGSDLLEAYNRLFKAAKEAVDDYVASNSDNFRLHPTEDGSLPISYNLAMTTSGMAICPRRSGGAMLQRDDGSNIGFVELNGTVLGGTLMVKDQEEWDVLKAQPDKLTSILSAIGFPTSTQTAEVGRL
ncbi:Ap4A phosphorylase-like protein II [Polyplosphaeria fusca]|uniref:Ap4A phosphorylase-like protein II n=1 Tax=Polyplosphaeria fusca TaxID=682080 RepID=A0A9P4R1H9_9PLEO|nr:Ap4A phosphorylase-like protein II [Polyplosphaeria fusca]